MQLRVVRIMVNWHVQKYVNQNELSIIRLTKWLLLILNTRLCKWAIT